MKENAKRDLPDVVPPLVAQLGQCPRKNCAGVAGMAAEIRRKMMLPEISFLRKVAQ